MSTRNGVVVFSPQPSLGLLLTSCFGVILNLTVTQSISCLLLSANRTSKFCSFQPCQHLFLLHLVSLLLFVTIVNIPSFPRSFSFRMMAATFKCQPTGLHGSGIDASAPRSSRNFGRFYSMRFACNTRCNTLRHVHTPLSISQDSSSKKLFFLVTFFISFF